VAANNEITAAIAAVTMISVTLACVLFPISYQRQT
jgi:Kef-type K+ transport system membrane component KefB